MTFNDFIEGVVKLTAVATPIVLAIVAFMQARMLKKQNIADVKQDSINEKVDGHITKLMLAADQGNVDKGKLEEKELQEPKTAALNDKLVEASKQIQPDSKPEK